MPNHVFNKITVKCPTKERAEQVRQSVLTPKGTPNEGIYTIDDIPAEQVEFFKSLSTASDSFLEIFVKKREIQEDILFDFNKLIPQPKTLFLGDLSEEERELFPGIGNWYDWNRRFWGTKWNAYYTEVETVEEDGYFYVHFAFNTAWSLPQPIYDAFAALHEDLYMEADVLEESHAFCCYGEKLEGETQFSFGDAEPPPYEDDEDEEEL